MKTYTVEELREILDNHKRWLYNHEGTQERADLCGANLRGADLRGADLCGADLRGADLCGADLCGANLCDADLYGADLYGANLCDADLSDADLCGANLCGVNGNLRHVKSLQIETYYITYTSKVIQIGCQKHTIEELRNFDDKHILEMGGRKALDLWKKWKPILMQIIELSPCEDTK